MTIYTTKIDQMTIGQRLRWLLDIRGQSIRELADVSGINYSTLQQYLSDKRKPGTDQLIRLANCGVDLHWLLVGREEPTLKLIFPSFEILRGPLVANSDLAEVFLDECFDAIDEFHYKWIEENKRALNIKLLLTSVFAVFSLYDRLLDGISDKIMDAYKRGWKSEDMATLIISGPVRDQVRDLLNKVVSDFLKSSAEKGLQ